MIDDELQLMAEKVGGKKNLHINHTVHTVPEYMKKIYTINNFKCVHRIQSLILVPVIFRLYQQIKP